MSAPYLDTHTLIVGASGAGKTVTAKVFTETLLDAERHVCIIDPTGAWHGLRSNATGDGAGYEIPIFGGPHGDLQIKPEQGEAIGQIIADGVSAIIDLSAMHSDEQITFMVGCISALRKKPKANFHLIVDEADEFAPERSPSKAGEVIRREMIWLAKRGRVQGFVLTLITQRPADIAKSVISQVQTLIAHQLISPADQNAIRDYLRANAPKETLDEVMGSLAGLSRGERWIYSPRADVLERGVSPMPKTFDSSRSPEPGETLAEPKMLAQIDLGAIRDELAKANEGEVSIDLPATHISGETLKTHSEFIAMRDDRDEYQRKLAWLEGDVERLQAIIATVRSAISSDPVTELQQPEPKHSPGKVAPTAERPARNKADVTAGETAIIPASQQRVVDAIAWWAAIGIDPVERNRASVIAGLSPTASTFGVYISKLSQAGYVDTSTPGSVALTDAGHAISNDPGHIERGDVAKRARDMLKPAAANVFDHILAHWPQWIRRDALADEVGLSRTASTLGVYISESSKLGFVETRPGEVRIAEWMMP